MRIILYQAQQNEVGGIETFNLNFCKRMSKYYDIVFVADKCDPVQKMKLEQYVPVYLFDNQMFEADVVIFSSAWGMRPEANFIADRYIQMVHADFAGIEKHWNFHYKKLDKVTEHYGGGENIAKTFKEKYGIECGVIPYLLDNEVEIKPVLHLISTTRIAKEKGIERIVVMAKKLKELGYKFNWNVWGSGFDEGYVKRMQKSLENVPEVSFKGLGRDLASYVADADYLVQLSDTEGYAFSIYESLSYNTPVIATAFPNAYEQIKDGKNGYILPFELFTNGIDDDWHKLFKKLYNKIPEFKFEPLSSEQNWIDVLGKPKKDKRKPIAVKEPEKIKVRVIKRYKDVYWERRMNVGEIFEVTEGRAKLLEGMGLVTKVVEVK